MTETNIITIITAVLAYLAIGSFFETFRSSRPSGDFDIGSLLLWPFLLDIRVKSWFKLRRIDREGKRRLAEAVAERGGKLRVVDIRWVDGSEGAIITVDYDGEIKDWCGSGAVWHLPDGGRASAWMESWLYDRWTAARREKT